MKSKLIHLFLVIVVVFSMMTPVGVTNATETNPEAGSLTIHKFEREPGMDPGEDGNGSVNQTIPDDAIPLANVTYEIKQTHTFDATTDTWSEITGNNGYTETQVTGADGKAVFQNLPLGRYKVNETDGPEHVNLNPDTILVDIPMTSKDGTAVNYNVHIYPKNETIRGAVELQKRNGENHFVGLAEAVFTLHHGDGSIVQEGLTTDSDGFIRVDGLAYGDYYFVETTAPNGFVLQSGKYEFTITKSGVIDEQGNSTGTVEYVTVDNYYEPEIDKTINGEGADLPVNRDVEFTYDLNITLPGDIEEYQRFVITDVLDTNLTYGDFWTVEGVDPSVLTFAKNGQMLTWTVNDFDALTSVNQITIHFTAQVNTDAPGNEGITNTGEIDFENASGTEGHKESDPITVIPTVGSLTIEKLDGNTDETLSGAEFQLLDADGTEVGSGTTDSEGKLSFTELNYGDYTLVETKAPNGYNKLTKPIEITVDAENHSATIKVKNYESGWELPKTGGIGTTLFTLIGLALMAAALFLYLYRKKMA